MNERSRQTSQKCLLPKENISAPTQVDVNKKTEEMSSVSEYSSRHPILMQLLTYSQLNTNLESVEVKEPKGMSSRLDVLLHNPKFVQLIMSSKLSSKLDPPKSEEAEEVSSGNVFLRRHPILVQLLSSSTEPIKSSSQVDSSSVIFNQEILKDACSGTDLH